MYNTTVLTVPSADRKAIKNGFDNNPEYIINQIEHNSMYTNREDAEIGQILHPLVCIIYKRNLDNKYAVKNTHGTLSIMFPMHIYNKGNYTDILKNTVSESLLVRNKNILSLQQLGSFYYPELGYRHILLLYEVLYYKQKYIQNENNVLYLDANTIFEKYMAFDQYSRKYIDLLYDGGK